jgi:leucyl-tRNA synthetase
LKLSSEVKELISDVEDFDEKDVLERNRDVLKELSETSEIIIYKADDPYAPDIMGKKKTAIPLKPAIYIET